jgi:hypothetical protein
MADCQKLFVLCAAGDSPSSSTPAACPLLAPPPTTKSVLRFCALPLRAHSLKAVRLQPGEYYNKEANIMDDIARFRKAAYTKDLLRSVGTQASPCPYASM